MRSLFLPAAIGLGALIMPYGEMTSTAQAASHGGSHSGGGYGGRDYYGRGFYGGYSRDYFRGYSPFYFGRAY
jgi:hypothetical protein